MVRARRISGFTAIEALVAVSILSVLAAAVSGALMAGRAQSRMARETLNASFLGQALMDEVMRLPYDDPLGYTAMGPDAAETRTTFSNIDDYSGYTDGPTGLCDLAGNAYPTVYQGYVRTVTMQAMTTSPTGWGATVTGLLVTVTVTKDGQEMIKLQRIAVR